MSFDGPTENFMRERAVARLPEVRGRARRRRVRSGMTGLVLVAVVAVVAVVVPLTLRHSPGRYNVEVGPPTSSVAPSSPTTLSTSRGATGAGTAAQLANGHWTTFPSAPLTPRGNPSQVWTGHELIVWGGANFSQTSNVVYGDGAAYNPSTRRWRTLPPAPISGRWGNVAVWTGTEMIIWGGYTNSDTPLLDGAAYNPISNSWQILAPSPLTGGGQLANGPIGVWTGQQLVVLTNTAYGSQSTAHGATYTPALNRWQIVPIPRDPSGHPIGWVAAAQSGNELVAWSQWQVQTTPPPNGTNDGGATAVETQTGTDVFAFNERTNQWRSLGTSQSLIASALTAGDVMYTIDNPYAPGSSGPGPRIVGILNPTTNTESPLPDPLEWADPSFAWTGAALASVAGTASSPNSATKVSAGEVALYDPTTSTWTTAPDPPAGCVSTSPVPTWTGHQLIIYPSNASSVGTPPKGCGLILTPSP